MLGMTASGTNPSVVYVATGETGERCCSVARSSDGGATWRLSKIPEADAGVDHGLALDPSHPRRIYAGISQDPRGGVARSEDGGRTWHVFFDPSGFRPTAWWVDPERAGHVYVGTLYHGVRASEDFGETWRDRSAGLPEAAMVSALVADREDPTRMYAGISDNGLGHPPGAHGLYVSVDAGRSWTAAVAALAGTDVHALVVDPRTRAIYAATDVGVLATSDAGATWSALGDGLSARRVLSLAWDPRNGGSLLAGTDGAGLARLRVPYRKPRSKFAVVQ
jgi:photosystem II stability/assembly factor-like uncharacterized protein